MTGSSDPAGRLHGDPARDVIVVGAGPVGIVLTNLLALYGLRVTAVEREVTVYDKPRARHIDAEAMRVLQACGVADDLVRGMILSPGLRLVNEAGQVLAEIIYDVAGPWPQGWGQSYNMHQPTLESALRTKALSYPEVDLLLGWEVEEVHQRGDHVEVLAREIESGRRQVLAGKYVVGCDGIGSTVRQAAGIEFEVLGADVPYLVVDADVDDAVAGSPGLPDRPTLYCWPRRPHYFSPSPAFPWRFEFMILPDDDVAVVASPAGVADLLQRFVPPGRLRIARAAVYTFHSRMATAWRRGRVLLAGDAAHVQPPFGAQGLMSGIRDCSNLAWKLATACRSTTGDDILESYALERQPHARAGIERARSLGEIVMMTDPVHAARRDAEMLAGAGPRFSAPAPVLGAGLHGDAGSPAGTLSIQPCLDDGRRLDDAVGHRFLVVTRETVLAQMSPGSLRRLRAEPSISVLSDADGGISALLSHHGAAGAVLRPDRYVLGVADTASGLEKIIGMIPLPHASGALSRGRPSSQGRS